MDISSPQFWIAVGQIIIIDILLGGDNAVVIALACRKLPEHQRNKGIFWGVFGAIALRAIFLFFAVSLLTLPYLKIIGGLLLFWIAIKMVVPEDEGDGEDAIDGGTTLLSAIKTVVIADAVMSLDNVVAVAAAAKDSWTLAVLGVLVSIPIVVWGSKIVLKLMDRFPVVILLGAALLGWIAGGLLVGDVAVKPWVEDVISWLHYVAAGVGAAIVVAAGKYLESKAAAAKTADKAAAET
ncbi:MAG: TerC family protein [Burkholderiales bacterium]